MPQITQRHEVGTTLVEKVKILLAAGRSELASSVIEGYLEIHPSDPVAYRILGRIRLNQGRPEDAVVLLKESLRLTRYSTSRTTTSQTAPGPAILGWATSNQDIDQFLEDDVAYFEQKAKRLEAQRQYFDPLDEKTDKSVSAQEDRVDAWSCDAGGRPHPEESFPAGLECAREDASQPDALASASVARTGGDSAVAQDLGEDSESAADLDNDDRVIELDDLVDDEFADQVEGGDPGLLNDEVKQHVVDDYEWDRFDDELIALDEPPTREEIAREVQYNGRISREQRARQIAIVLGEQYGWDNRGIDLLTEVFTEYWWSSAKRSMQRELDAGLVPDELRLAIDVRRIWEEHSEFGVSLRGYAYPTLCWPIALQIVRSFRGYPDLDEIKVALEDLFDRWGNSENLTNGYASFRDYLKELFQYPDFDHLASPEVAFGEGYCRDDDEYFSGERSGFNTPLYNQLLDLNLLPTYWNGRDEDLFLMKSGGALSKAALTAGD